MFSWITNIFSAISLTAVLALIGAGVGSLCWVLARAAGGFKGLGLAAAIGAFALVGTHWTGVINQLAGESARQQIADLEAQKAKLEHEMRALEKIRRTEQIEAALLAEQNAEREEKYQAVLDLIDKHKDDTSCISAEELEAIGAME